MQTKNVGSSTVGMDGLMDMCMWIVGWMDGYARARVRVCVCAVCLRVQKIQARENREMREMTTAVTSS